jgi:hypothetical protein
MYRMEFVVDASIDVFTFSWSSVPASCPDADGDGYDDWDGVYPHCTDDGLPQDCDDQNPLLHTDSARTPLQLRRCRWLFAGVL